MQGSRTNGWRLANSVRDYVTGTWSLLRAFPRPFWVLILGTFLNRFGTFVVPFLTLYMTRRGYTPGEAGIALGAYGVGHLVASVVGGHFADRVGRRNTIMLSMFSTAACMLVLSQARGLAWIWGMMFLTGLTAEFYRPASAALLVDLVPEDRRVTAFAVYRLAINAGWAFGPAVGGVLAAHSYFWLFVGDAVTSVMFGMVAWWALPHGRRGTREEGDWGEALRALRQDRRFLQLVVASFAVGVAFLQMSSTFPLQVTALGFSPAVYGLLVSLNGAIVVLCELPVTAWTQRQPLRPTLVLGNMLIGVGFGVIAFSGSVAWFAAGVVVFTAGEMLTMPVAAAFVSTLAPAHLRGRYMGAYGLSWAWALVLGPALGLRMFQWSPRALWLVCAGLGVVAAWVIRKEPPTRGARGG